MAIIDFNCPADLENVPAGGTAGPPGPPGSPGQTGPIGPQGYNSFSVIQQEFPMPPAGQTVLVTFDQTEWMVDGAVVLVQNGGYMEISSVPSTTSAELENLGYTPNVAPGTTVGALGLVIPAGFVGAQGQQGAVALPLTIGNGGTGQTTAQTGFNALSPISHPSQLIVSDASGNNQALGAGAQGYILSIDNTQPTGFSWISPLQAAPSFDSLSPLTTVGDLIGFNGTHNVRLGVGPAGYGLHADPTSATGWSWAPDNGHNFVRVAVTVSSVVLNGTEQLVGVVATASTAVQISLPSGVNWQSKYLVIVDEGGNASNNNITITSAVGDKIQGQNNLIMDSSYGAVKMYYNGTQWLLTV